MSFRNVFEPYYILWASWIGASIVLVRLHGNSVQIYGNPNIYQTIVLHHRRVFVSVNNSTKFTFIHCIQKKKKQNEGGLTTRPKTWERSYEMLLNFDSIPAKGITLWQGCTFFSIYWSHQNVKDFSAHFEDF